MRWCKVHLSNVHSSIDQVYTSIFDEVRNRAKKDARTITVHVSFSISILSEAEEKRGNLEHFCSSLVLTNPKFNLCRDIVLSGKATQSEHTLERLSV